MMTKAETTELLMDLTGVAAIKEFHGLVLALANLLPSPAWQATVRALAWEAAGEISRRRAGEARDPDAPLLDVAQAAELTPGERKFLVSWLAHLAADGPERDRTFVDSLRAIAKAIAALELAPVEDA